MPILLKVKFQYTTRENELPGHYSTIKTPNPYYPKFIPSIMISKIVITISKFNIQHVTGSPHFYFIFSYSISFIFLSQLNYNNIKIIPL